MEIEALPDRQRRSEPQVVQPEQPLSVQQRGVMHLARKNSERAFFVFARSVDEERQEKQYAQHHAYDDFAPSHLRCAITGRSGVLDIGQRSSHSANSWPTNAARSRIEPA